jgi:hypothetical protein
MVAPTRRPGRAVEAIRHALLASSSRRKIGRAPPRGFERGRTYSLRQGAARQHFHLARARIRVEDLK